MSDGRMENAASGSAGSREHVLRDDDDYAAHMDYVHFNPVKHGLAASPAEWPYSTFRSCVARGLYAAEWSGQGVNEVEAGEPGG